MTVSTTRSLKHQSEWCLSAFEDGKLVWENVEEGSAKHMRGVSRETTLRLWLALAAGDVVAIDREPWQPGYG